MQGRVLGHYQILSELGRGGMAVVYKAVDTRLGRPVALKVLLPQLTADPAFVQRFLREARTAGRLSHANIVTIYDVGEIEGTYFIAMQYLEGRTLDRVIADGGAMPLARVIDIAAQIAQALDYAHAQRVIHRDIKPTNIMVGADGRVTLTDFGIARAIEDSRLTSTGQMVGTPQYMAPEQAQGAAADQRTDVYALGIVLFEMLTGRAPFQATTPMAVLHKQVYEPPPSPRSFNPALSTSVERVLQVALAKDPQQRFRSAGQMVEALKGGALHVAPPRAQVTPVAAPATARAKPGGRSGLLVVLLGVSAIAVVLFIALLAMGGALGGETPAPTAAVTEVGQVTPTTANPPATATPATNATAGPATATLVTNATAEPPADTPTPGLPTDTPVPPTLTPSSTPTVETEGGDQGSMVYVPASCFLQGSTEPQIAAASRLCFDSESEANAERFCALSSFQDEVPQREVCLDGFSIDQFEVTNAQYEACVRAGVCRQPQQRSSNLRGSYYGNSSFADYPVVYVSWNDASRYCGWLGKRLPTEAEWEKAARGPDGAEWPWGDSFAEGMCNTRLSLARANSGDTAAVGSYGACASPYGAMDMVGNVWEWAADAYGSGAKRVIRGSSWNSNVGGARATSRAGADPQQGYFDIGFRCASD